MSLALAAVDLPRRIWLSALVAFVTILALGVKRFSPGPSCGIARAALGIAATSVGIGIGVRFASKSGPWLPTTLGCVALVAGICLLGSGIRDFLRAVRGWWRLMVLPVAVGALLTMYAVVPAIMAAAPAPTPLGAAALPDGLAYDSVAVRAGDGVLLSAWFIPSSNGAAVIVLHGSGSNRASTAGQATVLARHGFGVLMLDARGHGASGGQAMDFGWYGESDASAAVDWLAQQIGIDPGRIAVLGLSMGGEEAIGAAGADSRIQAVVAEGATARTAADKAAWLPGGVLGAIQRGLDRVTFGLAGVLSGAPEPMSLRTAASRASPRPILLIVAGTVPDEASAAAALAEASPSNVRTWVVPDAGHVGGLDADPIAWERTVVTFLATSLGLP